MKYHVQYHARDSPHAGDCSTANFSGDLQSGRIGRLSLNFMSDNAALTQAAADPHPEFIAGKLLPVQCQDAASSQQQCTGSYIEAESCLEAAKLSRSDICAAVTVQRQRQLQRGRKQVLRQLPAAFKAPAQSSWTNLVGMLA